MRSSKNTWCFGRIGTLFQSTHSRNGRTLPVIQTHQKQPQEIKMFTIIYRKREGTVLGCSCAGLFLKWAVPILGCSEFGINLDSPAKLQTNSWSMEFVGESVLFTKIRTFHTVILVCYSSRQQSHFCGTESGRMKAILQLFSCVTWRFFSRSWGSFCKCHSYLLWKQPTVTEHRQPILHLSLSAFQPVNNSGKFWWFPKHWE